MTRSAAQLHNQHVFRFLVPLCAISNFCKLDVLPYEFLKGGYHGFFQLNFFACINSLRNDMYNCMIVFLKNEINKVKRGAQK